MLSYLYKLLYTQTYHEKVKDNSNKFYYLSLIKESNNTFSIHGLWPQYTKNSYPTYCTNVSFNINNLKPIMPELKKNWYSTQEKNEDFWQHEYEKHGSCVFTPMTELEYFSKTLELYDKAIKEDLPKHFYNQDTQKCLIPVSTHFNLIVN